MVTSNKLPEKKVVTMSAQNNTSVVPQRTLLGEVNEHITCPLCRGYYIDATTIVECLHSFCRSCIIKHLQAKSYCPVCEMMINSAKPNIKLDKALQDIVYKLVPGLFQKEMERRQQFYASRPGPAASATPEQRGEDTERIIFSPEDVISFSLEYADGTDSDSISSKSSDSNESQSNLATTRRYLQCPAVVNINHLKKFLSMKFDIDSSQFAIDILYKRVPLPDYYTLMDIAYIYNWKRNEPMRFFYQIIDYIAIRNRFFDINKKGTHFQENKPRPGSVDDSNFNIPAINTIDQGSESSSRTGSPMLEENIKPTSTLSNKSDKHMNPPVDKNLCDDLSLLKTANTVFSKKNDDEVEKSQFLISFELTAKSNNITTKSSPVKAGVSDTETISDNNKKKPIPKLDDTLKRKLQTATNTSKNSSTPELKKLKIELEKTKLSHLNNKEPNSSVITSPKQSAKVPSNSAKSKVSEGVSKSAQSPISSLNMPSISTPTKESKLQALPHVSDSPGVKRSSAGQQNNISTPKRKTTEVSMSIESKTPKTVSPLKLQIPKTDSQLQVSKAAETPKSTTKKMPDLKPSVSSAQSAQSKVPPQNKVRMDLLANNSDPTIDRSRILSQVKSSMSSQNNSQSSGDPLKSIFDSCNINIPSSLSITLTDQKLDPRNPLEGIINAEQKKSIVNKNLVGVNTNPSHKIPSPPVHNYIEILKLPDTDNKKSSKPDNMLENKSTVTSKADSCNTPPSKIGKSSETAKGPVPNLKPISDTKLAKQTGPITFQQTFEQQIQSAQTEKKPKLPKAKTQVPKLVPAPKGFNVVSKTAGSNSKTTTSPVSEPKSSSALDLSTPHNIGQSGTLQTFDKALETMQSIANLAKKQHLPTSKNMSLMSQSSTFSPLSGRSMSSGASPLRIPTTNSISQIKLEKTNVIPSSSGRQDLSKNNSKTLSTSVPPISSPSYQMSSPHNSLSSTQPSPRSQTRSPSCSPKLVIAEDKQVNIALDQNMNQPNSISNQLLPNPMQNKSDLQKPAPGPSKSILKPIKPLTQIVKTSGIRPPLPHNPTINSTADYLSRPQLISSHHHLLRQMEVNAWLKVQRQFDLIKSMSNMTQNEFNGNNKDKPK